MIRRSAPPPVERIRLVALDCDGTVCPTGGPVGTRAARAIRALEARGVHVIFATGRSPSAARRLCRTLDLEGPAITLNGSVVTGPGDGAPPWHHDPLDAPITAAVHEILRDAGVAVAQVDEESLQYDEDAGWFPEALHIWGFDEAVAVGRDAFPARATMLFAAGDPPAVMQAAAVLGARLPDRVALFGYPMLGGKRFHLEVRAPGDDKGAALRHVRQRLGLPRDATLAIGDWFNDVPLLEEAGFAVAMAHAPAELARVAHAITRSSQQDEGAAELLEELFQLV